MAEYGIERSGRRALKSVAVAMAVLAVPACSKMTEDTSSYIEGTAPLSEAVGPSRVQYPETMRGHEYVDATENAVVDCASAENYIKAGNDAMAQYDSYRPWFVSGTGTIEAGYQIGGFIGDSNTSPDDTLNRSVKSGFYLHRGAENDFGVYAVTANARSSSVAGGKEVELKYINSFTLYSLGQNGSLTYETNDVSVILTQADDLPHYYDAWIDRTLRYPSAYPQGVSGSEKGPGFAVEVLCKIPSSTIKSPANIPETTEKSPDHLTVDVR